MIRSRPVTRHLVPAVAAGLAVLALVASPAAAQAQQERLPTELWEEYPLNPTPGQEERTEERPPPATTVEEPAAPRGGARPASPELTEGGTPWLLLVAVTLAFSGVLGTAVGIVLARRGGVTVRPRLAAGAAAARAAGGRGARSLASLAALPLGVVAVATRWRPSRDVVERLHSEVGSLAPLAEPRSRAQPQPSPRKKWPREESRKAKPFRPAGAPPEKEELSGVSPPPHKRKHVTSGLPPGKAVNVAAEQAAGRAAPARAKSQPKPEPMPQPAPPAHGQPARPAEERRPLRVAAPVGDWEECEIDWWRGYVNSDFYALAGRPGGERYVAARSPTFRWWRREPPPEESSAAEAHARLVARLVADGWESVGSGLAWYKTRLRRKPRPTLRELAKTL
ncbi:MAG: hypothetical protein ACRDOG_12600 [Gaiellaceae bacterium]